MGPLLVVRLVRIKNYPYIVFGAAKGVRINAISTY